MSNGTMNSINILYTPNINDLKRYQNRANPNNIIVSSYLNTGSYVGYDYYKGLSYELYYVDNNRDIHQLSYNLIEGNGISIRDNKFNINTDNDTLKPYYYAYNDKNYIVVNNKSLKSASSINKGVLYVDNNLYYNDLYRETIVDDDAVCLNSTNDIIMSSGLVQELSKISLYSQKCDEMMEEIKFLKSANVVNIGDILYSYTIDNVKRYTLDQFLDNEKTVENTPEMICVIASNVLPDNLPRFIPLKRNNILYQYDDTNYLYVKNALNNVPIFSTNDVNSINNSTKIIGSYNGFIATDRIDWKNNVRNPFNSSEHYYTNVNKIIIYEGDDLLPIEYSAEEINMSWYLDSTKIDYNDNYKLKPGAIYSNLIEMGDDEIFNDILDNKDMHIYTVISINYNSVTKYYMCHLQYNTLMERFVNNDDIQSYCIKKTITNNFKLMKINDQNAYEELFDNDINEFIKTKKVYDNIGIHYVELENCEIDLTNINETYIDDTYIITNKQIELTDISASINDVEYYSNKYKFNVNSSIDGQLNISISDGLIDKTSLILKANTDSETITITNNTKSPMNCIITITITPFENNLYKSLIITESKIINNNV